jgi:hypothetical protein
VIVLGVFYVGEFVCVLLFGKESGFSLVIYGTPMAVPDNLHCASATTAVEVVEGPHAPRPPQSPSTTSSTLAALPLSARAPAAAPRDTVDPLLRHAPLGPLLRCHTVKFLNFRM